MTNRRVRRKAAVGMSIGLTIGALLCTCSAAMAQFPGFPSPIVPEGTAKQVSPHVWVITSFPNIAIVVGDRATLVVDTGLGARNGARVAREAKKLSKGSRLYLTTTHFHPEHAAGDEGFPADTVLIRNAAQQKELEEHGAEFLEIFRGSPQNKELLEGQKFRKPDIVFDREARVDLGGVTARLFWLGGAHTVGDELTFIEEDSTLISGDVVQNKVVPGISSPDSSVKSWIAVLDDLAPLKPKLIVPDHSAPGDGGSLVAQERAFLGDLETRTLALKGEGKSADDAAAAVAAELSAEYADWKGLNNIPNLAKRAYAEQ